MGKKTLRLNLMGKQSFGRHMLLDFLWTVWISIHACYYLPELVMVVKSEICVIMNILFKKLHGYWPEADLLPSLGMKGIF